MTCGRANISRNNLFGFIFTDLKSIKNYTIGDGNAIKLRGPGGFTYIKHKLLNQRTLRNALYTYRPLYYWIMNKNISKQINIV